MKNPRDYTLGEIETLALQLPDAAAKDARTRVMELIGAVSLMQRMQTSYQVRRITEVIQRPRLLTRRKSRSVENEAYEHCILVNE